MSGERTALDDQRHGAGGRRPPGRPVQYGEPWRRRFAVVPVASAGSGSVRIRGSQKGSAPALRTRAASRAEHGRKQTGVRPIPITLLRGGSKLAEQSRRRLSRFGWAGHWPDFPGTSRKMSSGSKALSSLGYSADSSFSTRKTRGGPKSLILLRNPDDFPLAWRKTSPGPWDSSRRGHRASPP